MGAIFDNSVYHLQTPEVFRNARITALEMLNVFMAIKIFGKNFISKTVNVFCDNSAVVSVLQTGKTKDPLLAKIARNIFMIAASLDIFIKFTHVPGVENKIADLLSRWDNSAKNIELLHNLVPGAKWVNIPIDVYILNDYI